MCKLAPKEGRPKIGHGRRGVSVLIIDRKSRTLYGTDTHFY